MAETDDEVWLEQLQEALASTAGDGGDDRDADAADHDPVRHAAAEALGAHASPGAHPDDETADDPSTAPSTGSVDLGPVLDAIAVVADRVRAVESAAQELVRDARRPEVPDITEIEAAVTGVLRAELPAILDARTSFGATPVALPSADETLDQWAERVQLPHAPTADVVMLIDELRRRIVELEQLHRRALEELTGERRQLIDEAVDEIRKLLFGD